MSTSQITGKSWIGRDAVAEGRRTFLAVNPATGATLQPVFREASPAEADRAMDLAAQAFEDFRLRTAEERAGFLDAIADEILALGDALIGRANEETGLPLPRLAGERARTTSQLKMFASLLREGSWVDARIDRADPERKPVPKPDLRRLLQPIGPVVVFGASNFPLAFAVAGGDTASALAAGNTVVVKGHPAHPGTSELTLQAMHAAASKTGVPAGVISLLQGASNDLGAHLVRHPRAKAVGFTGSLRGGRALFDLAAARPEPIPVFAEMGSINPVFLLPGALAERGDAIASGLHQSVTLGVGQFCTNPGLIAGVQGEALSRLQEKLAELIAGSPPGTMLHSGIRDAYEAGTSKMRGVLGVRAAAQAKAAPDPAQTQAGAMLFTADGKTYLERHELAAEVFGPSTLLVTCSSAAELEAIARGLQGHLTATVHGTVEDLGQHAALIRVLETRVGRLIHNGYPTGVEVCASIQHGGPYPATTQPHFTSVGTAAILRFVRPICYQGWPQELLPVELRDVNERGILRTEDGKLTR